MKKFLLLTTAALITFGAMAELPASVKIIPAFYALRISQNGRYFGPYKGYTAVYDTETNQITSYSGITPGLGNWLANDGTAVGDGMIMKDGRIFMPDALMQYRGSEISCISADGKHVAGYIRNPEPGVSLVPYVADVVDLGELENVVLLPHPERDLFGSVPQEVSALWISEDGLTVSGQILDAYGQFVYPIVYKYENGKWNYSLPSESLFNPDDVPIILNPYENPMPFPSAVNFMGNPVLKSAYEKAYEDYLQSNGASPMPDPLAYMSAEEQIAYQEAMEEYKIWGESVEEQFQEFLACYYAICETSPGFEFNTMTMSPNGEYIYMNGGEMDQYGNQNAKIYEFTANGVSRILEPVDPHQAPNQVLSDGTLLSSPTMMFSPNCYMLLPGEEEFITLEEFLSPKFPELATWIAESFPGGTGVVSMSDDKTKIVGAFTVTQLNNELYQEADYNFGSYFIDLALEAGIETIISEPEDGVYKVYNLQGVKVLDTKDASLLNSLGKGIYIVNGKKVIIN